MIWFWIDKKTYVEETMSLTYKVLLGMVLGIVVGLAINFSGMNSPGSFVNEFVVDGAFYVVGEMFVNALKMMVVPLVLFSPICRVCGIGDVRLLGRIGTKAFVLYMLTTAIAIATALVIAAGLGIGQGMNAATTAELTGKEAPPLTEVLIGVIPSNPINAMSQGEMLSIIFFAILFGISLLMVGKKASQAIEFIEIMNEVMIKMVGLIMVLAPYAVFCLIAKAMADLGMDLLMQLIGYVTVLIAVLLFHLFVTLQLVLKVFSGLSPLVFEEDSKRTGICVQCLEFECDHSRHLAYRDRTHGRQQLGWLVHCAIRCHDQHGRHRYHAECCDRVHRQYLQCRSRHGWLSHGDHDVGTGFDRHCRCAGRWFDHVVDGVRPGRSANRRHRPDPGRRSLA